MKAFAFILLAVSMNSFAADVSVISCNEAEVSLNSVYSLKTYANGSIKLFGVDMLEPAASPIGLAVAIDRGDDLANMESFCRYIPGLSGMDLAFARSKYDPTKNALTIKIPVRSMDEDGGFSAKQLTVVVTKGATVEADLVKASLK